MAKPILWIPLLAVSLLAQPGAVVTKTMKIQIDGKAVTARKINGRWWSPDNRELIQTSEKWLWSIGGGNARHLVRWDHHRPMDMTRVAALDRSMGPAQVHSVLGQPNSVFPSDRPETEQSWDYYGSDGYKLSIHFSSSGDGIFTASYQPDPHTLPKDVAHLAFRFQGKTASEMFAERKSRPRTEKVAAPPQVTIPSAPAPPPAPVRKVSAALVGTVTPGLTRARVIEILGEPASRMAIAGGDQARETLRYQTETSSVAIVLIDGKVVEIR
jgi:hypothetical protein